LPVQPHSSIHVNPLTQRGPEYCHQYPDPLHFSTCVTCVAYCFVGCARQPCGRLPRRRWLRPPPAKDQM